MKKLVGKNKKLQIHLIRISEVENGRIAKEMIIGKPTVENVTELKKDMDPGRHHSSTQLGIYKEIFIGHVIWKLQNIN